MNRFFAWCASFFRKAQPVLKDVAPLAEQIAVRIDPKLQTAIDKAEAAAEIAQEAKDYIDKLHAAIKN